MRNCLILFFSLFSMIAVADDLPPPPALAAKAYLLKEFNSGKIIAQQGANERIEPASLTKLMTAYPESLES